MGCRVEKWSISELATAIQEYNHDGKRIVVPTFQRGSGKWEKEKKESFIESIAKGFPVGSMLFYEKKEGETYIDILIDGLQRGACIKNYVTAPTSFFGSRMVTDEDCKSIGGIVGGNSQNGYQYIRTTIRNFIETEPGLDNIQYFSVAEDIRKHFSCGYDSTKDLINAIGNIYSRLRDLYNCIIMTEIPVVIYAGDEDNLPEIFRLINSKGTPLNEYEIYAAAWPIDKRYNTSNNEIIEYVNKKYQETESEGYIVYGYDKDALRKDRSVNAFEYVFGLSKFLVSKYSVILGFHLDSAPSEVNTLGFELVNACLNSSNQMDELYKKIDEIGNLDNFEKALCNAIEFVSAIVSPIVLFKGNVRNGQKIFHSKYQILSMISTTFKKMYIGDYEEMSDQWDALAGTLGKNLRQYYVYDIITGFWSEGVKKKLFEVTKSGRYLQAIPKKTWDDELENFYNKSMRRIEGGNSKIQNPKDEEYVFLNCVYINKFSANQQLAADQKFDVEHIATKERMRAFIAATDSNRGLPISCIANLCYLPEQANRSKKGNNFYQDDAYLKKTGLKIKEIEDTYSFTKKADLEWMELVYSDSGENDYEKLEQNYTKFCKKRFSEMKKRLYAFLDIKNEER